MLLSFPKDLGTHPETGEIVTVQDGRYGPYVKMGSETRSLEQPGPARHHHPRRGGGQAQGAQEGPPLGRRLGRSRNSAPTPPRAHPSRSRPAATVPTSPTAPSTPPSPRAPTRRRSTSTRPSSCSPSARRSSGHRARTRGRRRRPPGGGRRSDGDIVIPSRAHFFTVILREALLLSLVILSTATPAPAGTHGLTTTPSRPAAETAAPQSQHER